MVLSANGHEGIVHYGETRYEGHYDTTDLF